MWANDAAKKIVDQEFTGEGPEISPCYLMNLLFQKIGWEGPAYMQAMNDMMNIFPVVTTNGRCMADGILMDDLMIPEEKKESFQNFIYLQYYWYSKYNQKQ